MTITLESELELMKKRPSKVYQLSVAELKLGIDVFIKLLGRVKRKSSSGGHEEGVTEALDPTAAFSTARFEISFR
jgi:hypothetical protein